MFPANAQKFQVSSSNEIWYVQLSPEFCCMYHHIHQILRISKRIKHSLILRIGSKISKWSVWFWNSVLNYRQAEGNIRCRGPSINGTGVKKYVKHSCYILQDNCLDPLFSVEETMNFAADLKLGRGVSKKNKSELVSTYSWKVQHTCWVVKFFG